MALFTIKPTQLDKDIAAAIAHHTEPHTEKMLQLLTLAADERVLLAASAVLWLATRNARGRPRHFADHLALNVAVSAVLPHLVKRAVDQQRPDRRIHGARHGVPVSGAPYDAFPSGHMVHPRAR